MLSPNHGLADKRNGPWAVPKSSEISHTETFSIPKSKNPALSLRGFSAALRRYMLPLFGICTANSVKCALTREKLRR